MTENQIILIENLAGKINHTGLSFANTLFERKIDHLNQLTNKEIGQLITRLIGSQYLSKKRKNEVKERYLIEEVRKIFKDDNLEYDALLTYQYDFLFKTKFKTKYNDHPLENNLDYEYGWQKSNLCADEKMYYLKFYDLMMLDYDNITYDDLIERLTPWKEQFNFKIYQTHNGYHVYLVSILINHRNVTSLMTSLKCDFYYIKFVYHNGFKIRLTPKLGREEQFIEKWIEDFGNGIVHLQIKKLLDVRSRFIPD